MSLFLLIVFHGLFIGYCSHLFGFNLYHTNHRLNGDDHDCLYYFTPEMRWSYQLIQYCIRSPLMEAVFDEMNNTNSFTFEDLRHKNITSHQLYEWSAPIDLIEHYQNYLENNGSTNNLSFYNCTYPWFGSRCEYRFDKPQLYFSEQVRARFHDKMDFWERKPNNLSCYTYLQCDRVGDRGQTPSACLDWREVCDGKVDCIDGGSDEELCWQLETNDCDNNTEFRCGNGLCIPLAFLRDDAMNADCLDRSDEPHMLIDYSEWYKTYQGWSFPNFCLLDPAFRCEDHMSHPSENNKYQLECGDGSSSDFSIQCMNRRITILTDALWLGTNVSDNCRRFFGHFIGLMAIKSFDEPDPDPSYIYANYTERYWKIILYYVAVFEETLLSYSENIATYHF